MAFRLSRAVKLVVLSSELVQSHCPAWRWQPVGSGKGGCSGGWVGGWSHWHAANADGDEKCKHTSVKITIPIIELLRMGAWAFALIV